MLVMFDGFDEVKPQWRKTVSAWLSHQMEQYQESVFMLTSRPGGYKDYSGKPPSSKLRVKSFNDIQKERFVQKWYLTQERYARAGRNAPEITQIAGQNASNLLNQFQAHSELNTFARNPLLLNMIATLHRSFFGQRLPQRRNELYRDIFMLQLRDRPWERGIDMLVPFPESQQILQKIALDLVKKNQSSINKQALEAQLTDCLNLLDFADTASASDFLKQMIEVSELIVKRDEDLEFSHLSFQGYLAGLEIKESKQENLLLKNWQASWWKETILLYCAQVNPTNFLRGLLQKGQQEALLLASECLRETRRNVAPEIKVQLENLRMNIDNLLYRQLENYLKNGQWKEADQETYRLMIQAVGKEAGQWLESEDLENFPCEDLRTINQLWVDYSNGQFGFNVQKEIYESLGGTRTYSEDIWENFIERIGWIKDKKYVSYSDFVFELNAPAGHLPFMPFRIFIAMGKDREDMIYFDRSTMFLLFYYSSLFSRANTCNI